jgi:hypothetical protein
VNLFLAISRASSEAIFDLFFEGKEHIFFSQEEFNSGGVTMPPAEAIIALFEGNESLTTFNSIRETCPNTPILVAIRPPIDEKTAVELMLRAEQDMIEFIRIPCRREDLFQKLAELKNRELPRAA